MPESIVYSVLENHAQRIRELVESKKYRSPEDFLMYAIEILVAWESSRPEECIKLMESLKPFSPEQEKFTVDNMKLHVVERLVGTSEIDKDETVQQQSLSLSDNEYLKLQNNFQDTKKYIEALKITIPENEIQYDGFPLLSGFFSRFLPIKIVLATLGHILAKTKNDKVELQNLRVQSYGIAEKISEILSNRENERGSHRNKKISTGFPKKGREDKDAEKIVMAQKRFRDKFVGKVRKSRIINTVHFEGALSALGLICAFKKEGKVFVSLTELGREFLLMDNRVIEGKYDKGPLTEEEYDKGPLTEEESDFILKKLIPQLELEQKFVDVAIGFVKNFKHPVGDEESTPKMTNLLDEKIKIEAIKYLKENPKAKTMYNVDYLKVEPETETTHQKISQWRLATMGRLAELKVVNWRINERGDSEYSLNKKSDKHES